jgi:hypothetical protein
MEEQTRSADVQEEEPWDEDEELRKVSRTLKQSQPASRARQRLSLLRPTRRSRL